MRCPEPCSTSMDREFLPPLAESEGRDLRQADAREARALISSLATAVTAESTAQAYEQQRDRGSPFGWLLGTTLANWMTMLEGDPTFARLRKT